jgi:hypothetical protein
MHCERAGYNPWQSREIPNWFLGPLPIEPSLRLFYNRVDDYERDIKLQFNFKV